jgi:hypothetical protein
VADLRTTVTEVVTGLGMLGFDDVDTALASRPPELANVDDATYDSLQRAWKERRHADAFTAALMNGRSFLAASDGLRGRRPLLVEWKGAHRAPGDEVVPADLRVDHVYLVSCKYLSRIVVNASPHHLFDRLLAGGHGRRGGDWFREVAAREHAALYAHVRDACALEMELPAAVEDLDASQRRWLSRRLRTGWPAGGSERYAELAARAADASAEEWRRAIGGDGEAMLWRLLRVGSAPYFVLGVSSRGFVRLRIATPWDWRQHYELRSFDVAARVGGQPVVSWAARVRDRSTRIEQNVDGHVEIRWSHGRFSGPPEAKVYLDTPPTKVPGYFPLV